MSTALFYDPLFLEHDTGHHPESAERLRAILKEIDASTLATGLSRLPFSAATEDDVGLVHTKGHIRHVAAAAQSEYGGYLDMDTPVSPRSYDAALMAAGATISAVDAVLGGDALNAFALVRPPGHHASSARSMGFCLFNNIAIATRHAQRRRGIRRVLIVDFDVHHGNGTQEVFGPDPTVLYFSTHQYPFYPGTGDFADTGTGPGRGYTVNVPLPAGTGDAGHLSALAEILVPVAQRFRPELILVSAGYDSHWMDPLGRMRLSVAGFAAMASIIGALAANLCHGRLIFALEGGYSLPAIAASVAATLNVMVGDPFADPFGPAPGMEPDIAAFLGRLKQVHLL